ncbi:hypothetical protein [Nocardia thraciensis]
MTDPLSKTLQPSTGSRNDDTCLSTSNLPEDDRPTAVGFLRPELAGLDAPRQATAIRRHAETLGYRYLYTVRPPERADDPVGYLLNFVAGIQVSTVIVFELDTVDHSPAPICEACDLETVVLPEKWARSRNSDPRLPRFPEGGLSVGEAVRIKSRPRRRAPSEPIRQGMDR